MVRIGITLVMALACVSASFAQNKFFAGFEMGPKMEFHQLRGAYQSNSPIDLVHNETVKPILGVCGGLIIDNSYMVRLGILRSSDEIRLGHMLTTSNNTETATPLNIYDGYLFPINFAFCKNLDTTENPAQFRIGTGLTVFGGIRPTSSDNFLVKEDPAEFGSQNVVYSVDDNYLDAQLNAFNILLEYAKPTSAQMEFQVSLLGRVGVSGSNFVDIEGTSPSYGKSSYQVRSSGTGWQLTFGFKYYFVETETEE